jgi:creatinine amidohydrolase
MLRDTMVDMKWTDIRDYAEKDALVLLPLGVIEEHGPHLCLGTDAYIAHIQCLHFKEDLKARGREAIIAPPFYWGVCQATGSFIGSFRIRRETATALLFDIMSSLAEFGFRSVFGITGHGDIQHNLAVLAAFREASEKLAINARYLFPEGVMQHYGLSGEESYICPLKPPTITVSKSRYPDVHAGDIETAVMQAFYPHLTDARRASSLPPVKLGDDRIMAWLSGGRTEELSPEGYLGAPADYEGVDLTDHLHDIADRASEAILRSL